MKVRYIGVFVDGVEVVDAGQFCPQGEVIDVADDLGARLLEQPDNWELDVWELDVDQPSDEPAPTQEGN